MKIAILGAGLSGLTLGYLLNQAGIDFEILEKEKQCGGLLRTLQEDGFTFDCCGSHVFFSKNKEVLDFILSLLENNKIANRRNTKVLYKGYHVKYPFENGLADLSKEENFECLYHFVQNLIDKEKGKLKAPSNLKEWFLYTFGKGISEKYLIPYNEKIWKYNLEKMALEMVERVPNPPMEDIMKSSLGIETEGYTHQLQFYYPKVGGIQALAESFEAKIKDKIIKGFEVKKLKKDEKWIISSDTEERYYDKVISTMPIQDLVKAIAPPKEVKKAASNLRYNSLICVMLGLRIPKINDLSWLYIPDKDFLPHRVSFPSNYSPYTVPSGKSSVLAEITCKFRSEIWKMKNDEIIERVISDLHKLKVINKRDVCFAKAQKTKYAYVISDSTYRENVRIARNHIAGIGIDLIGRFAEFEYYNMDACIKRALDYASQNNQYLKNSCLEK